MTAPIPTPPAQPAAPTGQAPVATPQAPTAAPAGQAPAVPSPPVPQPAWQPGQAPAVPQQQPYMPQPYQLPAPQPSTSQEPADGKDLSALPQWARKQIEDLRTENASRRVAARTAVVNQHAFAAAGQLGVNGHALLGSAAFQAAAQQLDPTAAGFGQQLAAQVQQLLGANPWMAAQPASPAPANQPPTSPAAPAAPQASGGDFPGGTGAGTPITEQQLSQMTPDQIAEAFQQGKLKHLL